MMGVLLRKDLSRRITTDREEGVENLTIVKTETWTVNCVITGSLKKVDKVHKWVILDICRRKVAGKGKVECLNGVVLEKTQIISLKRSMMFYE